MIKLRRQGKKIVGVEFNFKSTAAVITYAAAAVTGVGITTANINDAANKAQDALVRPIAAKVFDEKHAPYGDTMRSVCEKLSILIEMNKLANSDKPDLYKMARYNIRTSGRFPEDTAHD